MATTGNSSLSPPKSPVSRPPSVPLPPEVARRWSALLKEELAQGHTNLDQLAEQMLLRIFSGETAPAMRAIANLVDAQKTVRGELARVERTDTSFAAPGDALEGPFPGKHVTLHEAPDDPGGVPVSVVLTPFSAPITTFRELSGYRHEMLKHLAAIQLALSQHKRTLVALQMSQGRRRDELLPALRDTGAQALAAMPRVTQALATRPAPLPSAPPEPGAAERKKAVQAVVSTVVTAVLRSWQKKGALRGPDWRAGCLRLLSWMVDVLKPPRK